MLRVVVGLLRAIAPFASKLPYAVPSSDSSFVDCEEFHKVRPEKRITQNAEFVNPWQEKKKLCRPAGKQDASYLKQFIN